MPEPVILSWSGGKDSAYALHVLRESNAVEVVGLLTNVTAEYDRVSMHGVRRELVEAQASSAGLPLHVVRIQAGATNDAYERKMEEALLSLRSQGIGTVAFGDIFLADVRAYRERLLDEAGMEATFPLWGRDSSELAREFIEQGFRAITTCVDVEALDPSFLGRAFLPGFLHELPPGIDPCGENGEFHTFVTDGPIFREAIRVATGEVVAPEGRFHFCDLLPARS